MNEDQTGQDLPIPDHVPQRINEGMPVYDLVRAKWLEPSR